MWVFLSFKYSTTSTLSVGSTGSQARLIQSSHAPSNYQPVLMKDLGKSSSISSDSGGTSDSNDSIKQSEFDDEQYKLTEQLVDKHLNELKKKCMTYDTHDVVKFMEKLKNDQKNFETLDMRSMSPIDGNGDEMNVEAEKPDSPRENLETIEKKTDEKPEKDTGDNNNGKNNGQSKDNEKDKKPTPNHIQVKQNRKSSLSPQGSIRKPKTIDMDAYTSSSSGDNQVHIVKIKSSPSGSRKSSRNNSMERDSSKEKQTIKRPEGGILKKPSPKFDKSNQLKAPSQLRPDRFISPASSFESKSDKLSPSSEILPSICVIDSVEETQRHSLSDFETNSNSTKHHTARSRSLDCSMERLKPALKSQSHYENVSPEPHKYYMINARDSFELTRERSPIRYCSPVSIPTTVPPPPNYHFYNEPFYEYPAQQQHRNQHQKKRESRSLERPPYMRQGSSDYERYYEAPPDNRHRRYSEYDPRIQHQYYSHPPEDYLTHSYEQPVSACADCFYQNYHHHLAHSSQPPPPLPQRNQPTQSSAQKTQAQSSTFRQRQSRSRKKLSRRMSSNTVVNYFNKSFEDDDTNVQPNDEIHV